MVTFPHCEARILHAPGECRYCDELPDLQEARKMWGVAFTGHPAPEGGVPCPADQARPSGGRFAIGEKDHRRWWRNRAER